jgi:hypothetical protein
MAQMESQLKDLAAFVAQPSAVAVPARSAPAEVALTGTVSCGHCQGIQPMRKGYTQFSWALNSVSQVTISCSSLVTRFTSCKAIRTTY